MPDSYISRLINAFEAGTDRVAMRIVGDDGQIYTFGESLHAIRSIAYRLGEESIVKGDRVALIGENHPCWALAYLGTLYSGAVSVPLDPHGEIETLTNFIENSKAKLAFISSEVRQKFGEIQEKLGRHIPAVVWEHKSLPGAVTTGPTAAGCDPVATAPGTDFQDWIATGYPTAYAAKLPNVDPDDNALLIYTSGTTGKPKGVPLTHGNIMAELAGIDEVLKLTDKERILSLLPLFHAYLQIVNLWTATTVGCEVGYLKELSPAELGSAMKEFKPTILTTVPRLWYLFHKKIFDAIQAKPKMVQRLFRTMLAANGIARDKFGTNLGRKFFGQVHESFGGHLRIAISAGSRFDEDVACDFHKLGFTILQGYGLTETSGAATATFEDDNRVGSVGKPMRGTEIRIADPDKDGAGEVQMRGGVVFRGYYDNPIATAEAFTEDGWFRSGDLGRLDNDGHLYIVGRAKDVIVLPSGKNVHPEDLEAHYLKTPFVQELAILGIADQTEQRAGAERLAAVAVPDFEYLKLSNISNSKEAVRYALDDLGRELPEYQRVRDYMVRAEPLPRTASGKIKRFELKKAIEDGTVGGSEKQRKTWTLSPEDKALLESPAAKTIVAVIAQNAKEAPAIHPDMNLEIDLGLDSLARAETFAALEMRMGTEFSAEAAARALTVREVIDLLSVPGTIATGSHREKDPVATTTGSDLQAADRTWATVLSNIQDDMPEVRPILQRKPLFTPFAFVVYKIFNLVFRIFLRLEVAGLDQFKTMKRPFLICPNHQSFLDPFVVCSTYSYEFFKNTFHVGASEIFEGRLMSFVARMLNVVPVNPDTQLMKAMKAGVVGLKKGRILNIYPEGERAYDGELHDFKKGAAILATELDLAIVPVAIDGLHKVWARRSMKIRPGKVKIRFGEAFYPKDIFPNPHPGQTRESVPGATATGSPRTDNDDQIYEAVTVHLKRAIAVMISEMRSGAGASRPSEPANQFKLRSPDNVEK